MPSNRFAIAQSWTAADATLGKVGFLGILAKGSAADSTITILDGTAIKYVLVVGSTLNNVAFTVGGPPVAFQNMVVDLTGTASYGISYVPTTG